MQARPFFPSVVTVLVSLSALEARETLQSKTLDLSTHRGSQTFYVVLASRGGSSTGHALVIWGIEDDSAQRSTIRALGLYPNGERESDNCGSAVRNVPGRLMDELQNHSVQAINQQLIVRLDKEDFDRSLQLAGQWNCRRQFSLLTHDCVEFLRAVGEALQLPMPSRRVMRWTPQAYVRALLATVSDGTVELDSGVYIGSLMNGNPIGHGVLTDANGSRIEGTFRGSERVVGTGRIIDAVKGFRYEGNIVDFQAHGEGKVWRLRSVESGTRVEPLLAGRFTRGRLEKASRNFKGRHGRASGTASEHIAAELGVIEMRRGISFDLAKRFMF